MIGKVLDHLFLFFEFLGKVEQQYNSRINMNVVILCKPRDIEYPAHFTKYFCWVPVTRLDSVVRYATENEFGHILTLIS